MTTHKPGWWRRNGVALVVAVVLAATTVGLATARERERAEQFGTLPGHPVTVAAGETVGFGGGAFTLTDVWRTHLDGMPDGTVALIATFDVAPGDDGTFPDGCMLRLVESGGAVGERAWRAGVVWHRTADGAFAYCPSDAEEAYTLEVSFVVPRDVTGDLTVTVGTGSELPRYLSFAIDADALLPAAAPSAG